MPWVGDKVQVQLHGAWYAATVLEIGAGPQRGTYKIRYADYGSNWEEYVRMNRIAAEGPQRCAVSPLLAAEASF